MAYDLLFTNARVVDGTGSPWLRADVAIADGRIVAVGRNLAGEAARTIGVENQVLAPGFFDMHSHADISLLVDPRHEPKLFQGVTFELLGQDGLSYAPVTPEIREQRLLRLEEAIRKLSSYPARRLSIPDRGEIRERMWADVVVFDDQTIAENATYPDPMQLATGLSYLTVNGTLVLDNGHHTGATPGRALRHRK